MKLGDCHINALIYACWSYFLVFGRLQYISQCIGYKQPIQLPRLRMGNMGLCAEEKWCLNLLMKDYNREGDIYLQNLAPQHNLLLKTW